METPETGGKAVRLIDADKLEQDLRKEAARILAGDDYGKDRQRLARGLIRAADICRAAETVDVEAKMEKEK